MRYYDTFKRQITLIKLEQQGGRGTREANSYSEPFRIEFNNAFPVRLGELSLASDATDSKMEFTVDFAYETYTFVDGSFGQGSFGQGIVGQTVRDVIGGIASLL